MLPVFYLKCIDIQKNDYFCIPKIESVSIRETY